MNIILLTPSLNPDGGAEIYNKKLFEYLQNKGHNIDLITNDKTELDHSTTRTYQVSRVTVQNMTLIWRFTPALRFVWYVTQGWALPVRHPDLIIGSSDPISFSLARRFPRASFIFLPHHMTLSNELATVDYGSRWLHRGAYWIASQLENMILQRADYTVRFSRYSAELMMNQYKNKSRNNPRFLFLPQSVDLPVLWRKTTAVNPVRLLFVGRLIESKNCKFILEVLSKLLEYNWILNVVGDGAQRNELMNQAKEIGIEQRVHFVGHSNDTPSYYRDSDLLLFASKRENQPLVVLEAMSHGTPVLAIQRNEPDYVNALDEVITHNKDGYLAKSEGDFTKLLRQILHAPESFIGTTIRENARKTVAERHSKENVLDLFHETILQVIQSRKRLVCNKSVQGNINNK